MKDIRNDTKPMNIRPTILPIGDHSGDGRWELGRRRCARSVFVTSRPASGDYIFFICIFCFEQSCDG
jgi:hypothetical protein